MNKSELIDAVAAELGGRGVGAKAVDSVLEVIQRAVAAGEKVSITGFGVFERKDRDARTGRNPQTGEPVQVQARSVPAFRPGSTFKDVVAEAGRIAGSAQDRAKSAAGAAAGAAGVAAGAARGAARGAAAGAASAAGKAKGSAAEPATKPAETPAAKKKAAPRRSTAGKPSAG